MQIHQLLDACLFAISLWVAYSLRANANIIHWLKLDPVPPFQTYVGLYLLLVIILIPAAPLVLESQGFYERPSLGPRRQTFWSLFKGCLFITMGMIFALWFFRFHVARWVILWFGCISFGLIWLKEELLRIAFRSRITQEQFRRRFILVGTGDEITRMRAELDSRRREGLDVSGELNLDNTPVDNLVSMLHEHSVNGVILSARHTHFEQVEYAIKACELEGVEAWLVADFFQTQISRPTFDDFFGRPILVFRSTPDSSWQALLKSVMDFVGALLLLLLLVLVIPVFPLIALIIKLTSPGPVLFRQQRAGLNGKPFTIYKFRTMVTDAEQRQHELTAMNEMSGPVFKMSRDPRVTPIGRWLRKFSLDELPQLFNVLKLEMSLVGPRPLPVDEVKRFNDLAHRRRLSMKPGLTCLWQISGRNDLSDFRDWVRLDLEYIDNWSLWLDMKILCRTVPVVFAGTGAK